MQSILPKELSWVEILVIMIIIRVCLCERWMWTSWSLCSSNDFCSIKSTRYCLGKSCPNTSSLYFRSYKNCFRLSCRRWKNVKRTRCSDKSCDYQTSAECRENPSCTYTFKYYCNHNGRTTCTASWTSWETIQECGQGGCTEKSLRTCNFNQVATTMCSGSRGHERQQRNRKCPMPHHCRGNQTSNFLTTMSQIMNDGGEGKSSKTRTNSTLTVCVLIAAVFVVAISIFFVFKYRSKYKEMQRENLVRTHVTNIDETQTTSSNLAQQSNHHYESIRSAMPEYQADDNSRPPNQPYAEPHVSVVQPHIDGPATQIPSRPTPPCDDMGYLTPVTLQIPPNNGQLPVNKFGYVEIDRTPKVN